MQQKKAKNANLSYFDSRNGIKCSAQQSHLKKRGKKQLNMVWFYQQNKQFAKK